jgi:hypothetical protein
MYNTFLDFERVVFKGRHDLWINNIDLGNIYHIASGITPYYDTDAETLNISEDLFQETALNWESDFAKASLEETSLFHTDTHANQFILAHELAHAFAGGVSGSAYNENQNATIVLPFWLCNPTLSTAERQIYEKALAAAFNRTDTNQAFLHFADVGPLAGLTQEDAVEKWGGNLTLRQVGNYHGGTYPDAWKQEIFADMIAAYIYLPEQLLPWQKKWIAEDMDLHLTVPALGM